MGIVGLSKVNIRSSKWVGFSVGFSWSRGSLDIQRANEGAGTEMRPVWDGWHLAAKTSFTR